MIPMYVYINFQNLSIRHQNVDFIKEKLPFSQIRSQLIPVIVTATIFIVTAARLQTSNANRAENSCVSNTWKCESE